MAEKSSPNSDLLGESEVQKDKCLTAIKETPTPGRMLVRVKRRRSRSPAEALLLTNSISHAKRTKTEDDDKTKIDSKINIFRFTATLNAKENESNTKELVAKVLEETNKEIESAKAQKLLSSKPDKKSIKSIRTFTNTSKYPPPGDKVYSKSTNVNSVKARYRVIESKRGPIDPDAVSDGISDISSAISSNNSKLDIEKSDNHVAKETPEGPSDITNEELKNLYQLFDLELEDSKNIDHTKQKQFLRDFKQPNSRSRNNKDRKINDDDTITCNGIRAEETENEDDSDLTSNQEYVYDLYCHINQEDPQISDSKTKSTTSNDKSEGISSQTLSEIVPLPDFQSCFEQGTANIIGCDWKSAQEYLTSDLNDGMPDWWHRAGNTNYNSDFDPNDSDDSNAEDNWRNDYPDEIDGDDNDEDVYGFEENYDETFENDIDGLGSLQIRDSCSSDDDQEDRLVYSMDESKEFSEVSNRHGSAYASYKRKMQRFLEDRDDLEDDDELDNSSSDECSDEYF